MAPSPEADAASARDLVRAVRKDRLRAALFAESPEERRIGRYRVIGLLGRGGMGTVLEAVDDALERRVALKLLHHDVPARDQGRLLREARALARLSHPNVVQVHEVGESPRPFIAMELVRGRTLAEWQRERPPWHACVRAYLQAGRGLAAAHAQRLVHRDFKPSNCLIDDEGRVRVMDFGLARALDVGAPSDDDRTPLPDERPDTRTSDPALTDEGAVIGTLAYMPLEQLQGKEVDARSDQFGFCVALWEALHGERPFAGRTAAALERAMRHERVRPPPRESRVPQSLRRVLLRGLAADPARRWPTMDELLAALERLVRPRWRGRLALATAVGGLGLAGASVWHELAMRQVCSGVEDQLAGVWDPERHDALRDALLGSPLPYAPAAWEGIESRLAAYAEAWVEASHDVCEDARVRQEQPASVVALRTACLHERQVALREAVDVLASAEPSAVERAVGLVSQLPGLERCDDVPALLAAIPPPEDPQVQVRVQALRDELSEARALRIAGRYAQSLAVVDRVTEASEGVAYPPLRAEVELHRGWALYGLGRNDAAAPAFEDAYARAVAEGHDAVAADAAAMLSYIVGERQAKHELGIQWSVVARAHARRPAADPGTDGLALANVATVYSHMGKLELARSSFEEALARQEQVFGPNDVRLAFTINGLAVVLVTLNELEGALALHERALELRRRSHGPHHPHVAMSLNNIGVVLHRQARYAEAERYFREALTIKVEILGPDHPDLVSSLTNLGSLSMIQRDYETALAVLERGMAIAERVDGPKSGTLASLLDNVAAVQRAQGRLAEADASWRRALAIKERVHGPEHVEVVLTSIFLGLLAIQRNDLPGAETYVERVKVAIDQPNHPSRVEAMLLQVRLGLAQGDPAAVVSLAEQAYEQSSRMEAPVPLLAETRLVWSRALGEADPGARERALELAARAREELEPYTDYQALNLRAEADAWLAELKRRDPPR